MFCDPTVFFDEAWKVPSDAKYSSLKGTCANIVTKEVEPFVFGELPTKPKESAETTMEPEETDALPNTTMEPEEKGEEGPGMSSTTSGTKGKTTVCSVVIAVAALLVVHV